MTGKTARRESSTRRAPCAFISLQIAHFSDLLQNTLLELPLNLLALVVSARLAVEGHQGTQVELGGLQQLNLADVDLKRKYRVSS